MLVLQSKKIPDESPVEMNIISISKISRLSIDSYKFTWKPPEELELTS